MSWSYSILLLATIAFPLVYTLIHRRYMWSQYGYRLFLPSVWVAAVVFLVVDVLAIGAGWWGFNENNITGVYVGNLPLEELLFLVIIPQSCIFLWVIIRHDNAQRTLADALLHHYKKRRKQ